MSEQTIDHGEEARRILSEGETSVSKIRAALSEAERDGYGKKAAGCWAQAQVHATLALIEEQRLANQIAYVQLLETQYAEAAKHETEFDWDTRAESNVRHGIMLDRIREGLGL